MATDVTRAPGPDQAFSHHDVDRALGAWSGQHGYGKDVDLVMTMTAYARLCALQGKIALPAYGRGIRIRAEEEAVLPVCGWEFRAPRQRRLV